jgi:hypothetical protein
VPGCGASNARAGPRATLEVPPGLLKILRLEFVQFSMGHRAAVAVLATALMLMLAAVLLLATVRLRLSVLVHRLLGGALDVAEAGKVRGVIGGPAMAVAELEKVRLLLLSVVTAHVLPVGKIPCRVHRASWVERRHDGHEPEVDAQGLEGRLLFPRRTVCVHRCVTESSQFTCSCGPRRSFKALAPVFALRTFCFWWGASAGPAGHTAGGDVATINRAEAMTAPHPDVTLMMLFCATN